MKNINWKNVWVNTRLMLILAGLISLYSFTLHRNGQRRLSKSKVEFVGTAERLVSAEAVNKLLIENKSAAQTIRKDKLDLNKLESAVESDDMIAKAQVSVSIDGELKAVVEQKVPVVRLMTDDGSYYIDYDGNRMPLSDIYAARVPLLSGVDEWKSNKKLSDLFRFIHGDDFLKKDIIGIEILPSGSLMMKSRNYNYVIEYGKPINIERKFNNYKAFYQKAVQDSLISKYKRVNLKFTQQVICTK